MDGVRLWAPASATASPSLPARAPVSIRRRSFVRGVEPSEGVLVGPAFAGGAQDGENGLHVGGVGVVAVGCPFACRWVYRGLRSCRCERCFLGASCRCVAWCVACGVSSRRYQSVAKSVAGVFPRKSYQSVAKAFPGCFHRSYQSVAKVFAGCLPHEKGKLSAWEWVPYRFLSAVRAYGLCGAMCGA